MTRSEQDEKRDQELVAQIKIVKDKIRSLEVHLKEDQKERKVVSHSCEQSEKLGQLRKEERKLMDELKSIPER
ncbi:hypothetical protein ACFLW0_01180 [Chloroflexota bacterium]